MSVPTSQLATQLRKDGVVSYEGFWDAERCDRVRKEIESVLGGDGLTVSNEHDSYEELASAEEAILLDRSGTADEGMIDIFNIDYAVDDVREYKTNPDILEIINRATGNEYSVDNSNAYVNKSVTSTRGFHADTYSGKFKSFVYLTDVPDESYGPFSYVKGSHDKSKLQQTTNSLINRVKGNRSTDARNVEESEITKFTAEKGTLIIGNQAGYHRGWPQEEGYERMLITNSYTSA
ncbi:phytanoyl-CoA dioxygenase family protein [Halobacterium jilantaiense]|uniref:Phytanoyl-CoA dioxygenase (PhyH) n=1 Tax=Halobacterium jilantaiense TaxID=355548 RepID=A0A1I0MTW3_9EURY|nr:phytanoyl-CoA dioxygenase family protein [Halobacterium jilantaiense]SEV91720.1 Phytanoyl-CoA dioxygenase (PhyH) [Halobacterium jilantaiense]